jgi:hypothetical protein
MRAAGARVVEIPPAEFSHSHARNLGARHATGEQLLFMVQGAYPSRVVAVRHASHLMNQRSPGVVAVSWADYIRSDIHAMCDSMINTHYRSEAFPYPGLYRHGIGTAPESAGAVT